MQSHRQSGLQLGGGSAKRVVRKYRRMSLKREMRRLRRVVAAAEDAGAEPAALPLQQRIERRDLHASSMYKYKWPMDLEIEKIVANACLHFVKAIQP